MNKRIVLSGIAMSLTAFGCSTASVRMMPGERLNRALARDTDREGAEEAAVKAANKYCKEKGSEAIFTSNETKYTGDMEESTRNIIHRGSTAAMMIGGMGMVPDQSRGIGGLLGSAGTVGYVVTSGKDYEVVVDFKCRGRGREDQAVVN